MQKTLRRWMHSRSVSGHTLQMVIQVHEGRDRYDWQMRCVRAVFCGS